MDLTTQGMVAPEGYDPSTKDYKSSVFPTKLQSHKGQGIRSAYATAALTTRPLLFVHYSGTSAKTTACLSFHDSLSYYGRNLYASSGTVVSPAGVQLLLAKGCGLTSCRAVYTAVYSPLQDSSKSQALGTSLSWEALGRKLLTVVGCAVVSLRGTSLDSITRDTSGFHNLITYSESWFSLCSFPVLLLSQ